MVVERKACSLTKKQWAAEMVQVIATGALVSAVIGGGLCSLIGLGIGLVEGFVIRAIGMSILGGLAVQFREEDAMDRE